MSFDIRFWWMAGGHHSLGLDLSFQPVCPRLSIGYGSTIAPVLLRPRTGSRRRRAVGRQAPTDRRTTRGCGGM